jgi:hypothetical protein
LSLQATAVCVAGTFGLG